MIKSKHFLFSLVLLAFSLSAAMAFADKPEVIDGISFSIDKVSFGQWSKPRHHLVNDMVNHIDQDGERLQFIAITYTLTNTNEAKKIDLDGKSTYRLIDDHGNRYRVIKRPSDFKDPVLIVSKNFPSLYPGEKFGETLFFEAPVSAAKALKLGINWENLRLSKPAELTIPLNKNDAPTAVIKQLEPNDPNEPQGASAIAQDIQIISPKPGAVWDQGQSTSIQVASLGEGIPRKIIVIALDNTFQDLKPKKNNVYDINVPFDQPPGAYTINIIAEWSNGEISSTVLTFYVKDAAPLGVI